MYKYLLMDKTAWCASEITREELFKRLKQDFQSPEPLLNLFESYADKEGIITMSTTFDNHDVIITVALI